MKAMEVKVNGTECCVAGLPEFGVVALILTGVRHTAENSEDGKEDADWGYVLDVGGVHSPEPEVSERVRWHNAPLAIGDALEIRLVEAEAVSQPASQERERRPAQEQAKQAYLAHLKEQVAQLESALENEG